MPYERALPTLARSALKVTFFSPRQDVLWLDILNSFPYCFFVVWDSVLNQNEPWITIYGMRWISKNLRGWKSRVAFVRLRFFWSNATPPLERESIQQKAKNPVKGEFRTYHTKIMYSYEGPTLVWVFKSPPVCTVLLGWGAVELCPEELSFNGHPVFTNKHAPLA